MGVMYILAASEGTSLYVWVVGLGSMHAAHEPSSCEHVLLLPCVSLPPIVFVPHIVRRLGYCFEWVMGEWEGRR